ncbi:MAG: hypothetical protein ACREUP_01875, partial [Burkholderiales bacterium]
MFVMALLYAAWPLRGHAAEAARAVVAPEAQMQAGMRAFRAGDFTQALSQWSAAASGYEAAGNQTGQARALISGAEAALS